MTPDPTSGDRLSVDKAYEQLGHNFRYFLDWRHKILAGYFAVLGALALAYVRISSNDDRFALLVGTVVVSVSFWILDFRTRQIFGACQAAGAALDSTLRGSYIALYELRDADEKTRFVPTHGLAINLLVCGVTFFCLKRVINLVSPALAYTGRVSVVLFVVLVFLLELYGRVHRKREREQVEARTKVLPQRNAQVS